MNTVDFIQKNLMLFSIVVISGTMLVWPLFRRLLVASNDVSVNQAIQMINRRDAVVIDVRDDDEWAKGRIPNARHIPLAKLQERLGELEKWKNKPVVVCCQSGSRSAGACSILKAAGFAEVHNLEGGMGSWQQANLPLAK